MRDKSSYKPQKKQAEILDRAYDLVQSVPYRVGVRWLFYRLLQEGYYTRKNDYKTQLIPMLSKARHAMYKDWRPDTLADETREAIYRGHGHATPEDWIVALSKEITCELAMWYEQPYYVELWFEARAMAEQFAFYSKHITLRPMGGQPSIDYKYQSAQFLGTAHRGYDKPVVVLYFGDLDPAGGIIQETVENDARKWAGCGFEFRHCGLTREQVQRYNIPENDEKPGTYQWEALSDEGARDIITANVAPFISHDHFSETQARQDKATAWLRSELTELVKRYKSA